MSDKISIDKLYSIRTFLAGSDNSEDYVILDAKMDIWTMTNLLVSLLDLDRCDILIRELTKETRKMRKLKKAQAKG